MVVVASQSQRNFVLTDSLILPTMLTENEQRYYLLERIGRSVLCVLQGSEIPMKVFEQCEKSWTLFQTSSRVNNNQNSFKVEVFEKEEKGRGSL